MGVAWGLPDSTFIQGRGFATMAMHSHNPQPTGPGCQRKNPRALHTNDSVNLDSAREFWLQFANAIEFGQNNRNDFIIL